MQLAIGVNKIEKTGTIGGKFVVGQKGRGGAAQADHCKFPGGGGKYLRNAKLGLHRYQEAFAC